MRKSILILIVFAVSILFLIPSNLNASFAANSETVKYVVNNGGNPTAPNFQYTTGGVLTKGVSTTGGIAITADANTIIFPWVSSASGNTTNKWCVVPLCQGLSGYWPLDEATTGKCTGADVFDLTGNNITGTCTGSTLTPTFTTGKFGGALNFSANSKQNVTLGSTTLNNMPDMSLNFWVNMNALSSGSLSYLVTKQSGTGFARNFDFYLTSAGTPTFNFADGSANSATASGGSAISTGSWVCLGATRNGASAQVYMSGLASGSAASYSFTPTNVAHTLLFGFGGGDGNVNRYMNGKLDNIAIWNQTLTASEMSEYCSSTYPVLENNASSAGNTYTTNYYQQFLPTVKYTAITGSPTAPTLTFKNIGTSQTFSTTMSAQSLWMDNNSYTFSDNYAATTHRFSGNSNASKVTSNPSINDNVYEQYACSCSYSLTGGGSPTAPSFSATQWGSAYNPTLTTSPQTFWLDNSQTWTIGSSSSSSTSTERWNTNNATLSASVSAALTIDTKFYNQYTCTCSYSVIDGGSPTGPVLTGTQFGAAYAPNLSTSPTTLWYDNSQTWTLTSTSASSTSAQRWNTGNATLAATVSAPFTIDTKYYNQFPLTFSFSILYNSTDITAPTLTTTQFGSSYTPTLTASITIYWLDNGQSYAITNPLSGSTSNQRWITNPKISGTVSIAFTSALVYRNQFFQALSYSVSGISVSSGPPATGYLNGTSTVLILTTSPVSQWWDAQTISFGIPVCSNCQNNQWTTTPSSISGSSQITQIVAENYIGQIITNCAALGYPSQYQLDYSMPVQLTSYNTYVAPSGLICSNPYYIFGNYIQYDSAIANSLSSAVQTFGVGAQNTGITILPWTNTYVEIQTTTNPSVIPDFFFYNSSDASVQFLAGSTNVGVSFYNLGDFSTCSAPCGYYNPATGSMEVKGITGIQQNLVFFQPGSGGTTTQNGGGGGSGTSTTTAGTTSTSIISSTSSQSTISTTNPGNYNTFIGFLVILILIIAGIFLFTRKSSKKKGKDDKLSFFSGKDGEKPSFFGIIVTRRITWCAKRFCIRRSTIFADANFSQ